jgi:hypothetical protein
MFARINMKNRFFNDIWGATPLAKAYGYIRGGSTEFKIWANQH